MVARYGAAPSGRAPGSFGRRTAAGAGERIAPSRERSFMRCGHSTASDALEPADVVRALGDESRDVRVAGFAWPSAWLRHGDATIRAAVSDLADDGDWEVRDQLGASLGELPDEARCRGSRSIWTRTRAIRSRWMRRSAGSTGAKHASSSSCCSGATRRQRGRQPSACWQQRSCRRARSRRIAALLDSVAAATHTAVAALGASSWRGDRAARANRRPDRRRGAPPRAVDEPCPTCPGARGGPGGAAAFARSPAAGDENDAQGRGGPRDADAGAPDDPRARAGTGAWRPSRRINRTRWPSRARRYSRASAGREKPGRPRRASRRSRRPEQATIHRRVARSIRTSAPPVISRTVAASTGRAVARRIGVRAGAVPACRFGSC